jgi:hypothetical protein
MQSGMRFQILVSVAALATSLLTGYAISATTSRTLASPEQFAAIGDTEQRSAAIFTELGKVLTDPRCMNCHPAGDHPLQGDDRHIHEPAVLRGDADSGGPGLTCPACHTERNFTLFPDEASYQSIPGNPGWRLAPVAMAWEGKSIGEICRQIKDPARNGGRNLALLHDHMAMDDIVGWAWHPGEGRKPAPGSQEEFGGIVQAWIDTGAECP